MVLQAIRYTRGSLSVLDQLQLPHQTHYDPINNPSDSWAAIHSMRVRGVSHSSLTCYRLPNGIIGPCDRHRCRPRTCSRALQPAHLCKRAPNSASSPGVCARAARLSHHLTLQSREPRHSSTCGYGRLWTKRRGRTPVFETLTLRPRR